MELSEEYTLKEIEQMIKTAYEEGWKSDDGFLLAISDKI